MLLRSLTDRQILYDAFLDGGIRDSQIQLCDMDSMQFSSIMWNKTSMQDTNANGITFKQSSFTSGMFSRSSLMNSTFTECKFKQTSFSGITLIKSRWLKSRMTAATIGSCTMQRSVLQQMTICESTFSDFEGVMATVTDCAFYAAAFEITYGSGMNGFSGAILENCIFLNCRFSGYPLRGATLKNCVFAGCSGDITDDATCSNVFGLQHSERINPTELVYRDNAVRILKNYNRKEAV
jgi:uncharacterized protein YjbI with pentapeptide repeats